MHYSKLVVTLSLVLPALTLGCDEETSSAPAEEGFVQETALAERSAAPAPVADDAVIARLSLPHDVTVSFIDESKSGPSGGIGVLEVRPGHVPSPTSLYRTTYDASPLELFRALAPGAEPPQKLVENHAALERTSADAEQPRVLPTIDELTDELTPSAALPEWECYINLFHDDIANGTPYIWSHGHGHNLTAPSTTAVTGFAWGRRLAACVKDSQAAEAANVVVAYEYAANIWMDIAGSATSLSRGYYVQYDSQNGPLDPNRRYRITVSEKVTGSWILYHIEGFWGDEATVIVP